MADIIPISQRVSTIEDIKAAERIQSEIRDRRKEKTKKFERLVETEAFRGKVKRAGEFQRKGFEQLARGTESVQKVRGGVIRVGEEIRRGSDPIQMPKPVRKTKKGKTPTTIRRQPIRQPIRQKPFNFFAHRSNKEVFNDDSLTLFDSQKARRQQFSTGELFGI